MDAEWSKLKHPWERLEWARLYWQHKNGTADTKRAAAESLGMQENTYSAYERDPGKDNEKKNTPLNDQMAVKFGDKFKVNWIWLLTGRETPFSRTPAQQKAVDLLAQVPEDAQDDAVAVMETLIKRRLAS